MASASLASIVRFGDERCAKAIRDSRRCKTDYCSGVEKVEFEVLSNCQFSLDLRSKELGPGIPLIFSQTDAIRCSYRGLGVGGP